MYFAVSSSNLESSLRHGISSAKDHSLVMDHEESDADLENGLPRELQAPAYYYETSETGIRNNYEVAIGNPMKGLTFNPDNTPRSFGLNHIPASLPSYPN